MDYYHPNQSIHYTSPLLYQILPTLSHIDLDQHLYKGIGYDKLRTISSGLFYSPYAITALREYWVNGFENYLLGDKPKLKELSPVLYGIIDSFFDF